MSNLALRIMPELLRTVDHTSIGTSSYVGIGSPFANPIRLFFLQNQTDQTMLFSWDGINDHIALPASGFLLMDVTSNKTSNGGTLEVAQGTRFYVKGASGPTSGAIYLSVFFGFQGF